jgi:sugar phosphate isomerase/epimerase
VRLALCGNVFPADGPEDVLAALRGPVAQWGAGLQAAGQPGPFGFGLHVSARAAAHYASSAAARSALQEAMTTAGLSCWTANAFPFGDFHAEQVKQAAFLPDWTDPERVRFTLQVAELLAQLAPQDGSPLFISTCPLGYGPSARQDPKSIAHLRQVAEAFARLAQTHGRDFLLSLEPEPDGAFEKVGDLALWLADRFTTEERVHLGICFDLCHAAVVGEPVDVLLKQVQDAGVAIGKVQISSALAIPVAPSRSTLDFLARLTDDPYLHQVRGLDADGHPFAAFDVPAFLARPDAARCTDLRIHCHVPVSLSDFPEGLHGTPWKGQVAACIAAGHTDFELETYTLPVLPPELLESQGKVGTMVAESLACFSSLGLDTP